MNAQTNASNAVLERPVAGVDPAAYDIARRGFLAMQSGAITGDWKPMLDLLADDVVFFAPVEGYTDGPQTGKDRARALFEHHSAHTRTRLTPQQVLVNGDEIGFEIRAEGEIKGINGDYSNQLFMLFVVKDGKITRFREYAALMGGWNGQSVGRDLFQYDGSPLATASR